MLCNTKKNKFKVDSTMPVLSIKKSPVRFRISYLNTTSVTTVDDPK